MKANEEWRNDPERIEAAKYFRLARQDALANALLLLEAAQVILKRTTPEDQEGFGFSHDFSPELTVHSAIYRVKQEQGRRATRCSAMQ